MLGGQLLKEFFDKIESKSAKYSDVRAVLLDINKRVKNSRSTILDQTNQSFLGNFRSIINNSFNAPNSDDQEFFGILVSARDTSGIIITSNFKRDTRFYVDVPLNDNEAKNLDPGAGIEAKILAQQSQKIFYAVDDGVLGSVTLNQVVIVKLAQNHLNNTLNPFDNKLLGSYDKNFLVLADDAQTKQDRKAIKVKAQTELVSARTAILSGSGYEPDASDDFGMPLASNMITSVIGTRLTGGSKDHIALDLRAAVGQPVMSMTNGEVIQAITGSPAGTGNAIVIRYDRPAKDKKPYYICYLHLSQVSVKIGDKISKGQQIGLSGDTGGVDPHLHIEIRTGVLGSGERLQPQFIIQGTYAVADNIQQYYGYKSSYTFPFAKEHADTLVASVGAELPETPEVDDLLDPTRNSTAGTIQSPPTSFGKLKIVTLETDIPNGVKKNAMLGSSKIKIREDILPDIKKIKNILNTYGISFCAISGDVRLDNKNISLLGRVGLEVILNSAAGLAPDSNLQTDDYLIGPDYSKKLAYGYGLKIYGRCRQIVNIIGGKYQPFYSPTDVYYIKNTLNATQPEIIKVNVPLLDISKIFEDFGFMHALPKAQFFKYSSIEYANWNVWQKPSKIKAGYTYRELLETVYYPDNSAIWNAKQLVWNGDRFV